MANSHGSGAERLPYTPRTDLTPEEKEIERAVGEYFGQNLPALIREYRRRFGNIVDRNNAQELYEPYAKNREARQRLSLATHEPAGALADTVYFAMVAKRAPESKNIVLLMQEDREAARRRLSVFQANLRGLLL